MTKGNFRQADLERVMKSAKKQGMAVTFDLRTLVATILPIDESLTQVPKFPQGTFAPDGKENWDEE